MERDAHEQLQYAWACLQAGNLDEAQSAFDGAARGFATARRPLGIGHAQRGLARVAKARGLLVDAEDHVRVALDAYAYVEQDSSTGKELTTGSGAAHVLLATLQLRGGRGELARASLQTARELFEPLGDVPEAATLMATLGRLSLRDGKTEDAAAYLQRAERLAREGSDVIGQVSAALALSEYARLCGDADGAAGRLDEAIEMARGASLTRLLGRATSTRARLRTEQGDLDGAVEDYTDALELLRKIKDQTALAYTLTGLGDVRSRMAEHASEPESELRAAARGLIDGAHRFRLARDVHGMGLSLHRLAQHALRAGDPGLAILFCGATLHAWRQTDPVRGCGQSLRLAVKACAALRHPQAVVSVAWHRVDLCVTSQPNAMNVLNFYRERCPPEWVQKLDRMGVSGRASTANEAMRRASMPASERTGLGWERLEDASSYGPLMNYVAVLPLAGAGT